MVTRATIHLDGQLGTSSPERWSVGFTFGMEGSSTPLGPVDLDAWVTRAANTLGSSSLRSWWQSISTSSTVTNIRGYAYGPTGPALYAAALNISGQAGTGAGKNPFQTSRVFSLLTATPGRSGRGRVYVPAIVDAVSPTTGKATPVVGIEESLADWLNHMRRISDAGADILFPGVHSRVKDQVILITSVRVGDVLDTQRRRRDSLVEVYSSAPV